MNYDKIINATYDWLSIEKAIWFLLFFWLSLPVLFLVPLAIEAGSFYYKINWVVQIIYAIMEVSRNILAINNLMSRLPIENEIRMDWQDEVNDLLDNPVDISKFYEVMGLSENWNDSLLWKENK